MNACRSPRSPLTRLALVAGLAFVFGCPAPPQRIPDAPAARIVPREQPTDPTEDEGLGPRVKLGPSTMQIPRGWIPTQGAPLHWENAGGGDDKNPSAANMNVIIGDPKPLDVTWQAFWADLSAQYSARTEGIQEILGSGRDDVGTHPAWYFEIRRRESGVEFALLQYIIGTDEFVYYLTFAARADEFPRYEPLFRRAVASFRSK